MNISFAAHPFARKGASVLLAFSVFLTTFAPLIALPSVAHAYTFPSTNQLNKDKLVPGRIGQDAPYVNFVSNDVGEVTLEFVNLAPGLAFFEHRTDGNVLLSGTAHPVVDGDFIYPGGTSVTSGNTVQKVFSANEKVEIRLALGGERDWDFDWVEFLAVPGPTCNGLPVTILHAGGVGFINGTAGDDVILVENHLTGGITSLGGNDTICVASITGNIDAGEGDDWVKVDGSASNVNGGAGNDTIEVTGTSNVDGGPDTDSCTVNGSLRTDGAYVDGGAFTVSNCTDAPSVPAFTIVASKVVCTDESLLPNGNGIAGNVNASTASDWVAQNPGCSLASGWDFQWGAAGAGNGGNATVGEAPNYTTFANPTDVNGVTSVTIPLPVSGNRVEMREVLQSGYVPFSGDNNNDVSARLFCSGDGGNYDNWEWINNPQDDQTFHCVAFNAPEFSIKVTKYECPADTIVSRGANGPDDAGAHTAPLGCTLKEGAEFGYHHYAGVTDGSSPYAYGEDFSATAQTTDANGVTVFAVEKEGRYDIAELNAGSRVQDIHDLENAGLENPVLGLYCNTDPGLAEDNLDFVLAENITDSQADCVVYNAVPAPACELDTDYQEIFSGTETQVDGHDAAPLTFVHGNWTASIPGATWIWSEDPVVDPTVETTKVFTHTFTVAGTPTGASLDIAADNFYEVEVNGHLVGSELVSDNNFQLGTQDNYVITADKLLPGVNTLTITTINKAVANSNPQGNPAGLLFKLVVNENACQPPQNLTSTVNMCKLDDEQNPLEGWTLSLLGDPVGSVDVYPDGNPYNLLNVPAGPLALFASGLYTYRADPVASTTDAAYSYRLGSDGVYGGAFAPWVRVNDFPNPNTGWLGIMLNDAVTDWGSIFNPLHEYAHGTTTGAVSDFSFKILDDQYGDNSGFLTVAVSEGYTGVTDENGCVVFNDVPYGTYTAEEIMQEGWENISGLGDVEVNDPEETFYIVNTDEPAQQCDANAEIIIWSSTNTKDEDGNASLVENIHASWLQVAGWIWKDSATSNDDAADGASETFTQEFTVVGTPLGASLDIAADNGYEVWVNDNAVPGCSNAGEFNYGATTTCSIPAGMMVNGVNELEIEVTNMDHETLNDPSNNPAGLFFQLTLNDNQCVVPEKGTIVIVKEVVGGEDSTFDFTLYGLSGEDNEVQTAVDTDSITTENASGTVSFLNLAEGFYTVEETDYPNWNTSRSCISNQGEENTPGELDLEAGEVITCTFVNEYDEEGGGNGEPQLEHIDIFGNTSAGENQLGWMFNRDLGTQSPYEFNDDTASLDNGSLFVFPITNTINGNSDKFIAELFLLDEMADINSISYDFKLASTTVNADIDEQHFYMNVYANYGVSPATKFFDCRYNIVPTNGVIDGFVTATFDPTQSYPVTTSGSSPNLPTPCPASPADMGPGATIRVIALNVGDSSGSDTGISGYFDKVVVNTDALITTYDFEPTPPAPPEGGGGGNIGGGGGDNAGGDSFTTSSFAGEVAGVSTDDECVEYLHEYIKYGAQNNQVEVLKLQTFLNDFEANNLTLSGIYDSASHQAVHAFQKKYQDMVLTPWGASQSTGYVYYTTKKTINEIYCRFTKLFPLTSQQEVEIARVKALGQAWQSASLGGSTGTFSAGSIQLPAQDGLGGMGDASKPEDDATGTVAGTSTQEGGFWSGVWSWLIGR